MQSIINILTRKNYLRRITGVKHEKFQKLISELKGAWKGKQKRKQVAGRPYGVGDSPRTFVVAANLLNLLQKSKT